MHACRMHLPVPVPLFVLSPDCDELQTPLLDAQMALSKLHLCGLVWVAWTDFGSVGVGRCAILRKSDKFSQTPSHPGVDPVRTRYK